MRAYKINTISDNCLDISGYADTYDEADKMYTEAVKSRLDYFLAFGGSHRIELCTLIGDEYHLLSHCNINDR